MKVGFPQNERRKLGFPLRALSPLRGPRRTVLRQAQDERIKVGFLQGERRKVGRGALGLSKDVPQPGSKAA